MLSQGASKVNINLVVDDVDAERAISVLHDQFFLPAKAAK
jgi:aspartokinase